MDSPANNIIPTDAYLLKKAQQQVNSALTIRNWWISHYIVEYEHLGQDRADYGSRLYKTLIERLQIKGYKSIREGTFTSVKTSTRLIHRFCAHRPQNHI